MDRKSLLAMALCFLIFMGWQKFYIEPRTPKPSADPSAIQTSAPQPPMGSGAAPTSNDPASQLITANSTSPTRRVPETRVLPTATGDALLGDGNRAFVGWNLKSYKLGLTQEAAAVDLKSVTQNDSEVELAFDDPSFAYLNKIQGTFQNQPPGILWTYEDSLVKLKREITTVEGQPYLNLTVSAEFKSRKPNYMFVSLSGHSPEKDPEAQDRQLLYWSDKTLERVQLQKENTLKDVVTPVKYIGATNRYFLMALVNAGPLEPKGQLQPIGPTSSRMSFVYPMTSNTILVPLKVYFGPKELDLLRKVDPALDNTVDLGWFQIFAYPLLTALKFFYTFLHNYGLAIILLTILIKIVTYPLNYKSMKSMKDMAKLQPQLQKLREKHANDKEALNREMLTMMRTHGYNPAAGCVPMLIQMPIFFALYRVLYSSIELFHAPFALWIQDLSAHDPYYVTPVLLAGTMFLQQKLSPQTATDPTQQKMMQFMPLIFGFMMINLPSGLTIYMLTNAIASIIQQIILNKKFEAQDRNPVVMPA